MADQSSDKSVSQLREEFLKLAGTSKTGELLASAIINISQAMIVMMIPQNSCPGYGDEDRKTIWKSASKSFIELDEYCKKLERLTKWTPT